jgi:hypothetical protein
MHARLELSHEPRTQLVMRLANRQAQSLEVGEPTAAVAP